MAKMLSSFCRLSTSSANAIVVYFGMSMMGKLADFLERHWKDTFVQWQKCNICPDGTECVIILSPSQQYKIWCAAWACWFHCQVFWTSGAFLWPGNTKPKSLIYLLKTNILSPYMPRWSMRNIARFQSRAHPRWQTYQCISQPWAHQKTSWFQVIPV